MSNEKEFGCFEWRLWNHPDFI